MALRNPIYLDIESLVAQAEYHDIPVPGPVEVIEKTVRGKSGNAKAGYGAFSLGGSKESQVEYQSSYSMNPSQKASVSKVIDGLMSQGAVTMGPAVADSALVKDDIVEVEGVLRVTGASYAGKMFHILLRYLKEMNQDFTSVDFTDIGSEVMESLQSIYLGNELLPVPILVELAGSGLESKVYVNIRPSLFVDAASADRIEGDRRVLGTVRNLVGGDEEGYLSAEEWLLDGWEHLMKRLLMTNIDVQVKDLFTSLEIDVPSDDVGAWIAGPAVVLEAIAIY